MKVLVTGGRGMLGTDLCSLWAEHHQVKCTDLDDMDITDIASLRSIGDKVHPDIVVHLAALTDVDACEREPDAAYRVNALGTQNVAVACRTWEATLVYVSTISVFDGNKPEPYTELDFPNPQSHYSRAKYQGEQFVRQLVPQHYIARAGWMFGGGPTDKKFVSKIIALARERPELKVVVDKFGSPTYTKDLASAMLRLVETGFYGTYHFVNVGAPCSRYELACEILDMANIRNCHVVPVTSAAFPLSAPRPRMEAAIDYQCMLRGWDWMRPWKVALREYVGDLLNGNAWQAETVPAKEQHGC